MRKTQGVALNGVRLTEDLLSESVLILRPNGTGTWGYHAGFDIFREPQFQDGRRIASHLVNNSAALQTGTEPSDTVLRFVYRSRPDGRPTAFFQPEDGGGWFWPYHGVRTSQGLFLFLLQIEPAEGPAAFGFKPVATWLGKVINPDEPPGRWHVSQQKIPWGNERRLFGASVLRQGGTCYIYGTMDDASSGVMVKHMVVARAPVEKLDHFSAWRFFAEGDWVDDADRAGLLEVERLAEERVERRLAGLRRTFAVDLGARRLGVRAPVAALGDRGERALDFVAGQVAHVVAAADERSVHEPRIGRRTALLQDSLPRVGPEGDDLQREVLRQIEGGGQHAAVRRDQHAAARADQRENVEEAGAAPQVDDVRLRERRRRLVAEQQPAHAALRRIARDELAPPRRRPVLHVAVVLRGRELGAGEHGALAFIIRAVNTPAQFFWATGSLSSFLDNAPTYLTFLNVGLGRLYPGLPEATQVSRILTEHPQVVAAVSAGAVFMGANTYIGNAPNFMVKSIAEEAGVDMPSFFGYMFKYSIPILIPIFIILTLLFF